MPPYLIVHFLLVLRGEKVHTIQAFVKFWCGYPFFSIYPAKHFRDWHTFARRLSLSPRVKGFSITVEVVLWKAVNRQTANIVPARLSCIPRLRPHHPTPGRPSFAYRARPGSIQPTGTYQHLLSIATPVPYLRHCNRPRGLLCR